jgi:predicted permease
MQIAVCLFLLIAAGLFLQTLRKAQVLNTIRQPEKVLVTTLELASYGYSYNRAHRFYPLLLNQLSNMPGVQSAGLVWILPLSGLRGWTDIIVNRRTESASGTSVRVHMNKVSPSYFRTVGIPILRGRDFTDADNEAAPRVAIINQEMASRFLPGENPIGRDFGLTEPDSKTVIVGIVKDSKMSNIRETESPCVYFPLYQQPRQREMDLVLRVIGNTKQIAVLMRNAVQALDKDLPLTEIKTMKAHFNLALSQERMAASLLSSLGLLALMLAALGIFGIVSYSVAQRTKDIGIRMALGARPRHVLSMVLSESVCLVALARRLGYWLHWPLHAICKVCCMASAQPT